MSIQDLQRAVENNDASAVKRRKEIEERKRCEFIAREEKLKL
jgi:hypothetical protein